MKNRQLFFPGGKPLPVFIFLLLLLFVLPVVLEAAEVTYLVKPVQILRKGGKNWKPLRMGDKVFEGDTIRTGMGARVEITISPKRQFRIGQASEVEIRGLEATPKGMKANFGLILGRFWGSLRKPLSSVNQERFTVSTATATIGVKGTSFGVDYNKEDKSSVVAVVTGEVAVNPPPRPPALPTEIPGPREIAPPQQISRADWTQLVAKDQKVIIRPGEKPKLEPLTDEDKKDEWMAFNIARDKE